MGGDELRDREHRIHDVDGQLLSGSLGRRAGVSR